MFKDKTEITYQAKFLGKRDKNEVRGREVQANCLTSANSRPRYSDKLIAYPLRARHREAKRLLVERKKHSSLKGVYFGLTLTFDID